MTYAVRAAPIVHEARRLMGATMRFVFRQFPLSELHPHALLLNQSEARHATGLTGDDINGISSVDFVVTLQRGTEWAATGRVTQKVPANFPAPDTVSYRADLAAMDPGFRNGLDALTTPPRR
jgi:hypothetical protein